MGDKNRKDVPGGMKYEPKDPYLPPTRALPKKDPYLPKTELENIIEPEVLKNIDPETKNMLVDVLGMSLNIPQNQGAFSTYLSTIPERIKLRGYEKLAQKMSATLQNIRSAQQAKMAIQDLIIDEQHQFKIRHQENKNRLTELEEQEKTIKEEHEAKRAVARMKKNLAEGDD